MAQVGQIVLVNTLDHRQLKSGNTGEHLGTLKNTSGYFGTLENILGHLGAVGYTCEQLKRMIEFEGKYQRSGARGTITLPASQY